MLSSTICIPRFEFNDERPAPAVIAADPATVVPFGDQRVVAGGIGGPVREETFAALLHRSDLTVQSLGCRNESEHHSHANHHRHGTNAHTGQKRLNINPKGAFHLKSYV